MSVANDFADRDGWIWQDGKWLPWREARVHICTHTLHYGLGVFEGVRAYPSTKGALIFRLADHTARLFESAHIMNMPMPFDQADIEQVQREIVVRNKLDSAYIRPIVFYGAQELGLHASRLQTHVAVIAWEWGSYLGDESIRMGIRVKTSSFCRHHINAAMSQAKVNGHYVNSIMALNEAIADGYDEALMLDSDGFCAEGSGENIFCVRKGVLYTTAQNILPGITRDTIMVLARAQGIEVVEKRLSRDELYTADEIFMTGTAAEVTPVRELDRRRIRDGTPGELTLLLQKTYFDLVHGRLEQYSDWLNCVHDDDNAAAGQSRTI